jgi:hypothetical protein
MNRAATALRAWAAVHGTVIGGPLLLLSGLGAALAGESAALTGVGFIHFLEPIAVQLLIPAVAGCAIAVSATEMTTLPKLVSRRWYFARAGWSIAWTFLGILATNAALITGAAVNPLAVARNTLIFTGLSLVAGALFAGLSWLPGFVYLLTAMVFGYPVDGSQGDYYWWAVIMRAESDSAEIIASASLWITAVCLAVVLGGRRSIGVSRFSC